MVEEHYGNLFFFLGEARKGLGISLVFLFVVFFFFFFLSPNSAFFYRDAGGAKRVSTFDEKAGEHELCRADKGMICCIGMNA